MTLRGPSDDVTTVTGYMGMWLLVAIFVTRVVVACKMAGDR